MHSVAVADVLNEKQGGCWPVRVGGPVRLPAVGAAAGATGSRGRVSLSAFVSDASDLCLSGLSQRPHFFPTLA